MQTNDDQDRAPIYEFGWWPELAGLAMTAAIIAFLISLSTGML